MTYIQWSGDFALYLNNYLMYEHYYLGLRVSMTSKYTLGKSSNRSPRIFKIPAKIHKLQKSNLFQSLMKYMRNDLSKYQSDQYVH